MPQRTYTLDINRQTSTVNRLSLKTDPGGINLTHRSTLTAFGAVAYTRHSEPAEMKPSDLPFNVDAVHLNEHRIYAPVSEETKNRIRGKNPVTGHTVTYELDDDGFDLWFEGDLSDANQVGLDLDVAFMDVDQDAPENYQYTVQCPYCSEDRSVSYVYLSRPTGPGMLIVGLTPATWRLRYGRGGFGEVGWIPRAYSAPLHAVLGLQMLARVDSALDPTSKPGPVRQGVRIRFPENLREARRYMARDMGLPILSAPTLACEEGESLRFTASSSAKEATLESPDGTVMPVDLEPVDENALKGEVTLKKEGFYTLKISDGQGHTSDMVLRCGASWLDTLKRSVFNKKGHAALSAEGQYWAHAMVLARKHIGASEQMERYLYDILVRILMQGVDPPKLPSREPTHLVEDVSQEDGWYVHAPYPEPHTAHGTDFSAFHMFKCDRVQDATNMIELLLLAADAYDEDAFYEQAIRIAEAIIHDNIDDAGRIYRTSRHDPNITRDYTTVVAPLQNLTQLWRAMEKRRDPRAERLKAIVLKVADYLVARGFDFPTEGPPPHQRWTEDGSISCTALSLLYVYRHVEARPEYLDMAEKVLDFHESWGIDAPDVRMLGSSYRYWETQWENDKEGRAINAGHPWTLWRAEALYWYALLKRDPRRLLQSYNGYWTNRCKFMPDGSTYSCFTPDYIPDRPRRFELVHSYPETTDPSISYYLWPRSAETWWRTIGIVDAKAAGCDADCGPVPLNAGLETGPDGNLALIPHAPFLERVLLFAPGIGRVEVRADRRIEVIARGPVEVVKGRQTKTPETSAVWIEPEDGVIVVCVGKNDY